MELGYTLHSIIRGKESLPVGTVIPFKASDLVDLITIGAARKPTDDELRLYEMSHSKAAEALRDDGPTVAEYVGAGYQAVNYPPSGYASRSTPEEIADAAAVQAGSVKSGKRAAKQAASDAAKQVEPEPAVAKDPDVTEDALV